MTSNLIQGRLVLDVVMPSQKEKMEKELVEEELSYLMETTLRLEDELNSFTSIDEE